MTTQTATTAVTPRAGCSPAQRVTRSLLGYGVLAGAVFEASILIQGLTRHGFRLAHDDASLLSNGPLGWIQIATFLVSGAMTIACAVGMRRALVGPGAPAGKAAHVSWHAAGHLISASIGFTALIVACFVVARYFSRERRRGLAIYSRASGLAFLAAFAGVTTGSSSSAIVLPFYAGVLIAWIWVAVVSVHLYRRARGVAGV